MTAVLQGRTAFARTPKGGIPKENSKPPFSRFKGAAGGKYRAPAANQRSVEVNCPEESGSPSGGLRWEKGEQRSG